MLPDAATHAPSASTRASAPPLCVDLDGTLVRTDTLIESVLALLARQPQAIFSLIAWLMHGKAYFKARVAEAIELDVTTLPYNGPLLDYLHAQRKHGRTLVLTTASHESLANRVADHLGIFDHVMASNGTANLAGSRKLAALEERFGNRGFAYAGNASVDLKIWRHAGSAILVNAPSGTRRKLELRQIPIEREFADRGRLRSVLRAVRVHQWPKNVLVFIPLVLAHKASDPRRLAEVLAAFAAFCLCTSCVYLINDLADLPADRRHFHKRHRPFASGRLSVAAGILLAPIILVASLAVAVWVNEYFALALAGYFLATLGYSFYLKRFVLVDVVTLAGLYSIRLLAGGAAATLWISPWLLGFSTFMFLSLALVKRYSELITLQAKNQTVALGRGYVTADLPMLSAFGAASGYMAVLVLALYMNSPEVRVLYSRPLVLWAIFPLLIYWISRIWLLAHRGKMHSDPVLFALKDGKSYLAGFLIAIDVLLAL